MSDIQRNLKQYNPDHAGTRAHASTGLAPGGILIVQMGLPSAAVMAAHGETADWFAAALGVETRDLQVARPYLGQPLPQPDTFSVALITGSWSMVTDHEDWSERTARWARKQIVTGKPLLGICYGHQLMAYAMGGVVDYLPQGREQGTWPVTLNAAGQRDPLFQETPVRFAAHLSHSQAVRVPPPGLQSLGRTEADPHSILRYGPHAVSVQFHPEFTRPILGSIAAGTRQAARERGAPVPAEPPLAEAPVPLALMHRFVRAYAGA